MHDTFMQEAINLAAKAVNNGNHPFGSLLVLDNKIILTAENKVVTDNDCTKHAELLLVSKASGKFSDEILSKVILYTSTEPCAMCCGAIYWSGINNIVFGCSTERLAEITGVDFAISSEKLLNIGKKQFNIIGPILESEAEKGHLNFW